MGCAHEGAAISSTTSSATWTGAAGPGGGESAAACWGDEVPEPIGAVLGPSSGVIGLVAAVPGLGSEVLGLASTRALLESDPTSSGGAGTKMVSDSGEGLTDGLRRRRRATPDGIAWRVEPIRARASIWSLSFLGT